MPDPVSKVESSGRRTHFVVWILEFGLILFWCAAVFGIGSLTVRTVGLPALWGINILIIAVLLIVAGREINGQWFGILIDSRNKISLSRFQITLWTVMILSAYLTLAIPRVLAMVGENPALDQAQALNIFFPEQVILAMGISAASFTGANLIMSNKRSKQVRMDLRLTPEAAGDRLNQAKSECIDAEKKLLQLAQDENNRKLELEAAAAGIEKAKTDDDKLLAEKKQIKASLLLEAALQDKEKAAGNLETIKKSLKFAEDEFAAINASQGLLHKNADPSEAQWADLFRGAEIGNYKLVDMSKVQMLFFTVVVIVAYGTAILALLSNPGMLLSPEGVSFPEITSSLNALLGISHGTYLSVKTVDHS
ncbi:MAG: cell envelope integrity protein TolA [Anaerolineales bacterium]